MTVPHAYPGTRAARYDELQAKAMAEGVCIKIIGGKGIQIAHMHACCRERTVGLYCERHQR